MATLVTFGGSVAVAAAEAGPARATVADARPGWATAAADRGHTNPDTQVEARAYLAGRDPRGLAAFVAAVSDPKSPDYQHYLTPARYRARFGPTQAQVDAVKSWLRSAGLAVTVTNPNYVGVRGSAAAAERAFGTAIDDYADRTAGGAIHHAPAGRVTVPAAVSSAVLGVTGLDNGIHRSRPASAPAATGATTQKQAQPQDTLPGPPPVLLRPGPCSTYSGQNPATTEPPTYGHTGVWTNCGYTPQQIRSAYGVDGGVGGAGQTVAIVDAYASPTIQADMTTYNRNHGTADLRPGQFTQNLPASWNSVDECGGNGWYREESMDVIAVHAIAPDANIVYVGMASCNGDDERDALSRIVDGKLATIVTNSWNQDLETHNSQADRDAFEQIFKQGAAEGIGFYFSSGDCGADDPNTSCSVYSDGPGTEFPGSDPYVTAVGGTTMAVGADGRRMWQTGWNDVASKLTDDGTGWTPDPGTGYPSTYVSGSGGGTSRLYAQPSYQAGVVPTSLSKTLPDGTALSTPMRVVPDVAADGDNNTGILVGQTQAYPDGSLQYHETRLGGTSLSAPLFAAMQALAQQVRCRPSIGFANPLLYELARTTAFDDVTDTPLGASTLLGVVRNDYTRSSDPTSPLNTRVMTFGHNGLLHATSGYDNVTGIGSPSTDYLAFYNGSGKCP